MSLCTPHTWKNHPFSKKALIKFLLLPDALSWQIIHAALHGVSAMCPFVWLLRDPTIGSGCRKAMEGDFSDPEPYTSFFSSGTIRRKGKPTSSESDPF